MGIAKTIGRRVATTMAIRCPGSRERVDKRIPVKMLVMASETQAMAKLNRVELGSGPKR
jgi:hypothetical protein